MATIRQPTFNGGEFSPDLWGRTDLEKYGGGARTLKNFLVTPRGSLVNRSGTSLCGEVKTSSLVGRYYKFVYASSLAFVLEFGNLYIRVYRNGARVGTVEITTPYLAADLARLKFAQVGAILTITHQSYAPRDLELTSTDGSTWSFGLTPVATVPTFALDSGLMWARIHNWSSWSTASPAKEWQYAITALFSDGTESVPVFTDPCTFDRMAVIPELRWTYSELTYGRPAKFCIYLGRGGQFGLLDVVEPKVAGADDLGNYYRYLDSTSSTDTRHVEIQGMTPVVVGSISNSVNAPDFAQGPPQFKRPFHDAASSYLNTHWYNVGDRVFADGNTYEAISPGLSARTGSGPSGTSDTIEDGETARVPGGTYAVNAYIRSNGEVWKCLTSTGPASAAPGIFGTYVFPTGVSDGGLTWEAEFLSGKLVWEFLQVGQTANDYPAVVSHFDQRRFFGNLPSAPGRIAGSRVDRFESFDVTQSVLADDAIELTLASRFYEEIRSILPAWGLILLGSQAEWSLTGSQGYLDPITPTSHCARQQSYCGSSWLDPLLIGNVALFVTATGAVVRELLWQESQASMASSDITVLSRHLFEGHTIIDWDYADQPYSTIWAVRDDGVLLSCCYLRDQQMVAWTQHETDGLVENVCCIPEGTEHAVYLLVNRTIGGATKRFIERMTTRRVTTTTAGIFLDCSITYSGVAATHITGLSHLEGETVNALADGNVVTGLVVSGGAVDLPADLFPDGAVLVHVGLPYVSDLELLDVPPGEGRTRVKIVKSVAIEYCGSRGGYVGQSFTSTLEEWQQRDVEDDYGAIPLETGLVKIPIASSWNTGGRAVLRQVDPLPLTILAVTREVEFAGA